MPIHLNDLNLCFFKADIYQSYFSTMKKAVANEIKSVESFKQLLEIIKHKTKKI